MVIKASTSHLNSVFLESCKQAGKNHEYKCFKQIHPLNVLMEKRLQMLCYRLLTSFISVFYLEWNNKWENKVVKQMVGSLLGSSECYLELKFNGSTIA